MMNSTRRQASYSWVRDAVYNHGPVTSCTVEAIYYCSLSGIIYSSKSQLLHMTLFAKELNAIASSQLATTVLRCEAEMCGV